MIFSKNDRIVFLGDSVTDAGSVCPIGEGLGNNAGHGYVRMIDNLLASVYPELCVRVTNAGISGNDSRHLLARTERDCLALNPDWISVCIGINDVWRQFDAPSFTEQAVLPEEYEQNLSRILAMCRSGAGVKGIFLLTPFYIEPNREDPMRKRMDEYGAICARLAENTDAPSSICKRCLKNTVRFATPPLSRGTACTPTRSAQCSLQENFSATAALIITAKKRDPLRKESGLSLLFCHFI